MAALCVAALAGCQGADDTASGSDAVSASDAAEPSIKYIKGNFTYEECVELPDYKGLELTRISTEVTDEDVDTYISSLVTPEAVNDKDAVCAMGDVANIDYDGTVDGEARDGMSAAGFDLTLGSHSFISGFEEGIVGMKVGEEKDLTLTFPDDYYSEDLQGVEAVFHVKVNSIKRYPEVTDEWVSEFTDGEYKTADEYKESIKEELSKTQQDQSDSQLMMDAWDQVMTGAKFIAVPEDYVKKEMEAYDEQLEEYAGYYDQTVDEYLETLGMSKSDYEKQKLQYAEENAKNLILIEAIWEKEGMSTDDDTYKDQMAKICEANQMSEEELKEAYGEEIVETYCKQYAVMGKLVEMANITESAQDSQH